MEEKDDEGKKSAEDDDVGETVDMEDGTEDEEDEYVVSAMCVAGTRVGGWPLSSRETLGGGDLGVEGIDGDGEEGVVCGRDRCCWYFG